MQLIFCLKSFESVTTLFRLTVAMVPKFLPERAHGFSLIQSFQVWGQQSLLDGYLCQPRMFIRIIFVFGHQALVADIEDVLNFITWL